MRLFLSPLLLLWLTGLPAQPKPVLRYLLEIEGNTLHVSLEYDPVEPDSTVFTYGQIEFGGQADIFTGVRNVRVSPPGHARVDPDNRRIVACYPGREPVTISYDIVDTHTKAQGTRGELFRPMILPDYFYTHGVNIFLTPDFLIKDKPAPHSVAWKKPPPYRFFFGFDPRNDGSAASYPGSITDFRMAPVTGAADLTVDTIRLGRVTNYLVLRSGNMTAANKKDVLDYFVRFNTAIRRFWKDDEEGEFSLILQPYLEIPHEISGIAYEHGFIGKYYGGDRLMNARRMFVISHEVGHHWIGQKLSLGSENQWFNEGFNDYCTYYNLMQAGLMDTDSFEAGINDILRAHYASKVRNTPNDSVFINYWKMGDYNKLPYWRGCLFAFYLDHQIIKASGGRKNLRDLLLALFERKKKNPAVTELTTADFIAETAALLPQKQVEQDIDRYITKGDPIPLTGKMLLPGCRVRYEGEIPVLHIRNKAKFAARFQK